MHVLYLYFLTYVLCLCECVHVEEGSEEKIKEKGTSSSKSCNHARKSNTANTALQDRKGKE